MTPHTVRRKTKELLAIALILNAVAIGVYVFLFVGVKTKNEHISTLVNEIEARVAEEDTHSSIKTIAAQTAEQRKTLQNYIVAKEGVVPFIELLERTGKDIGVTVDIASVQESEIPGTGAFEHLTLSFTATGTWQRVVRFLGLLEFLPYEVKVTQAAVSKMEKQAGLWGSSLSLVALKEK